MATGQAKHNPVLIQPNGIASVKDGLQYMQDGKVGPTHVICLQVITGLGCNPTGQWKEDNVSHFGHA